MITVLFLSVFLDCSVLATAQHEKLTKISLRALNNVDIFRHHASSAARDIDFDKIQLEESR